MSGDRYVARLRAPVEDGGAVVEPSGDALAGMVRANIAAAADCDVSFGGRALGDLRAAGRGELLRDALAYVGRYRDVEENFGHAWRRAPRFVYLTGHQPELFHPGVWLKNFVLDALAKRDGAAAVHVLIDNDEARSAAVRVPGGSLDAPHIEAIPFDADAPPQAWEERTVHDKDVFLAFADRAAQTISPFVDDPLVRELWQDSWAAFEVTNNLGECVAQLRHRMEAAWGVQTLEIPLSNICRSESFHWFVAYLIAERQRLLESYNGKLVEYRRRHRLRSRSHPVPDLASDGEWVEMPLWIWTRDDPQRRRLFVSQRKEAFVLSDRQSQSLDLTAPADGDVSRLAADLAGLENCGIKLRPRALVTTMYLRTVLSDLFVHGIGGAKYDEVTDGLIVDVLGIDPPSFVTATGTRRLPIDRPKVSDEDIRALDRELRDLEFHPERFIDLKTIEDASVRDRINALLREKQQALGEPASPTAGRKRHLTIMRVNAALADHVSTRRTQLLKRGETLRRQQSASEVLASREFAACLFPGNDLRRWLLDAAADAI